MVWLKQRRRMRIRRRRRSILARRVRTAAFCASQEAELRAAVTALATDLLLRSSVHRRSVWMRNRSQAFMQVISAWDDLEWKRNFRVSRATYRHLCNELQTKVQHDSSIRETVVVEKRVVLHCEGLAQTWNIAPFPICLVLACLLLATLCMKSAKQ